MINIQSLTYDDIKINNPVGVDRVVDNLQKYLNEKILWLDIPFGIAYKNETTEGKTKPEVFVNNLINNKDYIEVFPDDRINFCFFDVNNIENYNEDILGYNTDIRIIFFVDLKKAYPNLTHRATSEVHRDIDQALKKYGKDNFQRTKIIKTTKEVYQNYSYDIESYTIDMQPFHVFAIEGTVRVNYNCILE